MTVNKPSLEKRTKHSEGKTVYSNKYSLNTAAFSGYVYEKGKMLVNIVFRSIPNKVPICS